MTGRAGFRMFLWPLHGNVTLLPRLLVVVRLLRLVVLVFEECFELHGEGLLFVVGCWLLCNRYVWSYWFFTPPCMDSCCFSYLKSCLLFCAICTASCYGFFGCKLQCWGYIIKREEKKILYFPTVWWSLFCLVFCVFVAEKRIVLSWIILRLNCKNLVDRCARETLRFIVYFPRPYLESGSGILGL